MSNKISIYAAGGGALNIVSELAKYTKKEEEEFADMSLFFIDTSRSNLSSNIPDDSVYLVEGLDGSGKRRDSNYTALSECSKEILHTFKPGDLNIVVHSASGGKQVM